MSDTGRAAVGGLSDRAAVAMLTLQLRTAQKELADVRAEAASFDEAAACRELRARLEPLEAERMTALEAELVAARNEANTAVEAARARAAEIVEAARAEAAAAAASAVVVTPAVEVVPDPVEPAVIIEPTPVVAPTAAVAPVVPQIVFDAETFARVFATVIAETLEKARADSQPQQQQPPPGWPPAPGAPYLGGMPGVAYGQYPYYQPVPPPKEGFWSHARHPDVLLLGLATIIVLVIMVAWLS